MSSYGDGNGTAEKRGKAAGGEGAGRVKSVTSWIQSSSPDTEVTHVDEKLIANMPPRAAVQLAHDV